MKNISLAFLLFSLVSLTFLSSCDPNEGTDADTGKVNISFRALYNGQPLVMNQSVDYGGVDLAFSKIRFFISDLGLIRQGETLSQELKEIEMVDITGSHLSATSAAMGFTLPSKIISVGSYDKITFGLGVPSDDNATVPADYGSTDPLSEDSDYWQVWNSYIFSKLEGSFNEDGNPSTLDGNLLHHVGTDATYKTITLSNQNITIQEGADTDVVILLEVADLLRNTDGTLLDLSAEGFTHTNPSNPDEVALSAKMANNWSNAFSVE